MNANEEQKKQRDYILDLKLLTSGVLITILLVCISVSFEKDQQKKEAMHLAEVYSIRIEALLDTLFHKTDVLESIIITGNGEVSESTFEDLAKSLTGGEGIRAIQYLPEGTVTYCYPKGENEQAIGDNVFDNPKRREDAILAVKTKEIAISGPYELIQGGWGLIARNPICLTGEDGKEKFWGFSVIILDLPEALNPIFLDELKREGYQYQLHTTDREGEEIIIAGNQDLKYKSSMEYSIKVPNHTWTLSLVAESRWHYIPVFFLFSGFLISVLCSMVYAQEQQRKRKLQIFAITDELTRLYNRRWLSDTVDQLCEERKQTKQPFFLLYMDLNHFKEINDTMGHLTGDGVLKETAMRIKSAIGKEADLSRIGGDEFVAIFYFEDYQKVDQIIQKIQTELANPFLSLENKNGMTVSIGSAIYPLDGDNYDVLIQAADHKMYEDKREGKKRRECLGKGSDRGKTT